MFNHLHILNILNKAESFLFILYNVKTNKKKMMQNVNINRFQLFLLTDTLIWL